MNLAKYPRRGRVGRLAHILPRSRRFVRGAAAAGPQTVEVAGLGSAQAFGVLELDSAFTVGGLDSAQVFGVLELDSAFAVSGLGSAQMFGVLELDQIVHLVGLDSAQQFGTTVEHIAFLVIGLGSAQAFGSPVVTTPGGEVFRPELYGRIRFNH